MREFEVFLNEKRTEQDAARQEASDSDEELPEPESHAMDENEYQSALKEIATGDKFIYEPKNTFTVFNGADYM